MPSESIKENIKSLIKIQTEATCNDIICLEKYCYNNEEILKLEQSVIFLAYKHHLKCKNCQEIRKRKEEQDLLNSKIKCETTAICGEIIDDEIFYTKEKKLLLALENRVIEYLHYHELDCQNCQKEIKRRNQVCQRREKIKKIREINEQK